MDEIDAIGGRRFSEGTSADREIQRTLMELLSQLDGFDVVGKVRGRGGMGPWLVCGGWVAAQGCCLGRVKVREGGTRRSAGGCDGGREIQRTRLELFL
jgi:ATP-dependent 26S proteasome regulatory subunit